MVQGKRKWAGLVFAVLIVTHVSANDLPLARPEELGFSSERLNYIDKFYADKVKNGKMAGIVTLISRHGKVAHFSAVGYADLDKKRRWKRIRFSVFIR
jgi:hypothetical protein